MILSDLAIIDNKIKTLIDNYISNSSSSAVFNNIAIEIHQFQYKYNSFYYNFCKNISITNNVSNLTEIPFFSIESFKGQLIPSTVPISENEGVYFETSGTLNGQKGKVYRDKYFFELIKKTVFAVGFKIWFQNFKNKPDLIFLDYPNKRNLSNYPIEYSVLYNIKTFFGSDHSNFYNITIQEQLNDLIELLKSNKHFVIIGPSYYLSNLIDYIYKNNITLKIDPNSLILDSGGLKNKSSHLNNCDYLTDLLDVFGIYKSNYFNTYALTEIGSQFTNMPGEEYKVIPPWTKIRIVKKMNNSFIDCNDNEIGNIIIYDLLNRGCLLGLLTSDLGILKGNTLKVIGREISKND